MCALALPAHAETIKVALTKLLSYPSVPIAIERGYFKAQGLDPEMAYFSSAEPIAVALAAGDVDFGVSGLGAAFYTLAAQGRIRVLASSAIERPGFFNLAFLGSTKAYDDGLTSAHALPGHSFAVTQIGTSLQYTLGLLAEKDKFPLGEVSVRPLYTIPNVISALSGSQIDAAVLPATPALPLLDRGTIKLLGWASDLVPGWMGAVAFTSSKHADNDGDLVKRFLIAYRHGSRDYHDAFAGNDNQRQDNSATPPMLDLLSKFTGIPPALIDRAVPYLDPDGRVVMSDLARQIAWYRAHNMMKADVAPADFVDRRYAIPMPEGK
ncbi:MAG TPA: ABC transporter substrate-binding protein [Stellaceae bacterium]|nr:ABC transporter substrate-binding protein [Stellaceae bacterium]